MLAEGWADGPMEMTKVIGAFRGYVNAPNRRLRIKVNVAILSFGS
jgi:hypothetical protein